MTTQSNSRYIFLQQKANEKGARIFVYELENGNRFETFDQRMKFEKVGGSKVSKLVDIIEPEKTRSENEQA